MIGLETYDNATKEHWRNWVWKETARRLAGAKFANKDCAYRRKILSQKTIVYLCGPDDFDRSAAIRNGFQSENLIAVDISGDAVKSVRKDKGLAIRGEISEVLKAWPPNWKIDGIIADMCCGLEESLIRFSDTIFNPRFQASVAGPMVICVNLQRGRESVRANLSQSKAISFGITKFANMDDDPDLINRAKMWLDGACFQIGGAWEGLELANASRLMANDELFEAIFLWAGIFRKRMEPKFSSYLSKPSNKVWMDSVVATWNGWNVFGDKIRRRGQFAFSDIVPNKKVKAKVSAIRAVRTMRLSGQLPSHAA